MKKMIKLLAALALAAALTLVCCFAEEGDTPVRVAGLNGPTGMALAHMNAQNDGTYEFTFRGAPDQLSADIIQGNVDIAAVPINLGSVLYNKTEGGVKALSLITRGMLYVLEKGDTIHSVADLEGKTIVTAGQGATPEYAFNFILDANDVHADLEFLPEHAEVTTQAVSGLADIVLLPEPHVTNLLMKDSSFRIALDVTEEFARAAESKGYENAQLSMSVVIVRSAFLEEHPEKVEKFLSDLEASIAFANENVAEAAQEIETAGIIPSAKVAETALPSCRLVFVTGADMQAQAAPLYDILFAANPASVGGKIPANDYYVQQ